MKQKNLRIYVAMSGGVDSSVAAAILKKSGHDVVGVFMKPWQPRGIRCLWQKDREDAMRVAAHLNIPIFTWDFSKQYEHSVTQAMIRGYRSGITPNPDILCNKEIKFDLFLNKAIHEGADAIATGHYARIKRKGNSLLLMRPRDKKKDQTYFLWTLQQKHLAKIFFPLQDMTKSQVRTYARAIHLPNAEKKDSQGICFVGPIAMKLFLKKYIPSRIGDIHDMAGSIIGHHDGAAYYTIGQRHGMDIRNGKGPYFVVAKNMKKNILIVGTQKDLLSRKASVRQVSFVGKSFISGRFQAQVRYRTTARPATIQKGGKVIFSQPERAITPGQSIVFYRGDEMIGGGIIASAPLG